MNFEAKLRMAKGVLIASSIVLAGIICAMGFAHFHRVPDAPFAGHGMAWVYADDLVPGPVCAPIYDAQGRVECMVLVTQSNGTFSAWRK